MSDLLDVSKISPNKAYFVKGKTLLGILKSLDRVEGGENVERGPGIYIRRGGRGAGYTISAKVSGSGGVFGASAPGPFGVSYWPNPDDPSGNTFLAQVNEDSDILKSSASNDWLSCTGLGSPFPLISNDVIWVSISFGFSYNAISAKIKSYGLGDSDFDPSIITPWTTNSFVKNNGADVPIQTEANILIGYSTPDTNGKPYFIQAQRDHLLLENIDIGGLPAVYDCSHRRRYGITAP